MEPVSSQETGHLTVPGFQAIIKIEEGAATSGQPGWVKASVEKPSPARVAVSAFYPYRYGISKDM